MIKKHKILATAVTLALGVGWAGQVSAGVYAGSSLDLRNLQIVILEGDQSTPIGLNNFGQFDFNVTNTATLTPNVPGAVIAPGGACLGNAAGGTTTCAPSSSGAVLAPGPADINGGRTAGATEFAFLGPNGDAGGVDYGSASGIIVTSAIVDVANGLVVPAIGPTETRQIAEAELNSKETASGNADIGSTTSINVSFVISGPGFVAIQFEADPSLLAQIDDSTASGATSSANMRFSLKLSEDSGPNEFEWLPTLVTGGACTTNVSSVGIGCISEVVAENLNGQVTASNTPFSQDEASRLGSDVGFQAYSLFVGGLTAGAYTLSINEFTNANVTRAQVPEPGTLFLLGVGLIATFGGSVRRQKRRA